MKSITTLLFHILFLQLPAQVLFQITEPASLKGIYPCQSPDAEWGSPNLQTTGNWFSDTVLIANDGIPGGACDPLNNSLTGNFGIARRNADCSMGVLLTNLQNAGATGALIIDTVDGRPLSFPSDGFSQSVSIPFLVISESQGDSLLNRLLNGETVIVGMGNKAGVYAIDAGLYKNRCLWYTNVVNDDESSLLDTNFGAWVFNPGLTDLLDLQLSLNFSGNATSVTFDSDPFDLDTGDSLFVSLQLPSANFLNAGDYFMQYTIIVPGDEDTTDNSVIAPLRIQHERSSPVPDFSSYNSGLSDYLLRGGSLNWGDTVSCFMIKEPIDGFLICANEVRTKFYVEPQLLPAYLELDIAFYKVQIINGEPYIEPDDFISDYSFADNITDPEYELIVPITGDLTGSASYYYVMMLYSSTAIPFRLLFTSDEYPDERISGQSGLQVFYYQNLTISQSSFSKIEPQLTPVFEVRYTNDSAGCYWSTEKQAESVFTLSPNPTRDYLNIQGVDQTKKHILIQNMAGVVCKEWITDESEVLISDLPSGVYLIQLQDSNDHEYHSRFVKI